MNKSYSQRIGDPFPLVPIQHFQTVQLPKNMMKNAWELVGPTINRNMQVASMQDLFCIAFMEGVRMASMSRQDTPTTAQPEKDGVDATR